MFRCMFWCVTNVFTKENLNLHSVESAEKYMLASDIVLTTNPNHTDVEPFLLQETCTTAHDELNKPRRTFTHHNKHIIHKRSW